MSPPPDTRLQRQASVASCQVSRTPRRSASNTTGTEVVPFGQHGSWVGPATPLTTHQDHLLVSPPVHPLAVADRPDRAVPPVSKHTQTRARPEHSTTSLTQSPPLERPTKPPRSLPGPPLRPSLVHRPTDIPGIYSKTPRTKPSQAPSRALPPITRNSRSTTNRFHRFHIKKKQEENGNKKGQKRTEARKLFFGIQSSVASELSKTTARCLLPAVARRKTRTQRQARTFLVKQCVASIPHSQIVVDIPGCSKALPVSSGSKGASRVSDVDTVFLERARCRCVRRGRGRRQDQGIQSSNTLRIKG